MTDRPGSDDMVRRARERLASTEVPARHPVSPDPPDPATPPAEPAPATLPPPEPAPLEPPPLEPPTLEPPPLESPPILVDEPGPVDPAIAPPSEAEAEPSLLQRLWAHRWIAVVAIVGISFVGNPFDNSRSVVDVGPGDCFQAPSELEVADVDVVDCTAEHDYETFAVLEHTAGEDAVYPGEGTLYDWAFTECIDRFAAYVGTDYMESVLWVWPMVPTAGSWEDGDRGAICVLYASPDGFAPTPVSTSARGTGR